MSDSSSCSVCGKQGDISLCSGCKLRHYCGAICQKSDWKSHRKACASTPKWYDKHRKARDGNLHEGRLELVTWDCPEHQTGWGALELEKSAEVKQYFETHMGGDEELLFGYLPRSFRWSCCGLHGKQGPNGCDHHGTGTRPCTCDFCRMGKPVPDSVFNTTVYGPFRHGLTLRRGPDSRSFDPQAVSEVLRGRSYFGLET